MSSGCRVEVMAFSKSASSKLKEVADEFIDLSEDKKTFLMPLRPFRNRLIPRSPHENERRS
jgi:uncharacterized LabA/DUF88 family protein